MLLKDVELRQSLQRLCLSHYTVQTLSYIITTNLSKQKTTAFSSLLCVFCVFLCLVTLTVILWGSLPSFDSVKDSQCPSAVTRAKSLQTRAVGGDWSLLVTEKRCKNKDWGTESSENSSLVASSSLIMTVTHVARWMTMPPWSRQLWSWSYSSFVQIHIHKIFDYEKYWLQFL